MPESWLPNFEPHLDEYFDSDAFAQTDGQLVHSILELLPCLERARFSGVRLTARLPRTPSLKRTIQHLEIRSQGCFRRDSLARLEPPTSGERLVYDGLSCESVETVLGLLDLFDEIGSLCITAIVYPRPSSMDKRFVASGAINSITFRPQPDYLDSSVNALFARHFFDALHYTNTTRLQELQISRAFCMAQNAEFTATWETFLSSKVGRELPCLGVQTSSASEAAPALLGQLFTSCPSLKSVTIACSLRLLVALDFGVWQLIDLQDLLARFIPAIPLTVREVIIEADIRSMKMSSELLQFYRDDQAEALVVVEDAIVNHFGSNLPLLRLRSGDPRCLDFDSRELKSLVALFPRLQAAGRLLV